MITQQGMIRLDVDLHVDNKITTYAVSVFADQMQGDGLYVNYLLPDFLDEHVYAIKVRAADAMCTKVEITSKTCDDTLSIDGVNVYRTDEIALSYAWCQITVTLMPEDDTARNRYAKLEEADELVDSGWELMDEGLIEGAIQCAQEAVDLIKHIADSNRLFYWPTLADAYYLLGYLYENNNTDSNGDEAIKRYKTAETMRAYIVKYFKNTEALRKYAQVECSLGRLYSDMDCYPEAKKYLSLAAELYKNIEETTPDRYREQYADALASLAHTQRMCGLNDEAIETCNACFELCKLPHNETQEVDFLVDACLCQENISLIYSDTKKHREAIVEGEKLITMLTTLAEKEKCYTPILEAKRQWLDNERQISVRIDSIRHIQGVDLGLTSGTIWADCNLGASTGKKVGDFYAWGAATHNVIPQKDEMPVDDDIAGSEFDPAFIISDGKWVMPTASQIQELCDECSWKWHKTDSFEGYLVTGPSGESIVLPAAGKLFDNKRIQGTLYWSSCKTAKEYDGPYDSTYSVDNAIVLVVGQDYENVEEIALGVTPYLAPIRPVQADDTDCDDDLPDDDGRYDAWA